jgi:hypothetical protein
MRVDASGAITNVWSVPNAVPGGWTVTQRDRYFAVGDVDGDGRSEILVHSRVNRYRSQLGLLRYDSSSQGLKATWISSGPIMNATS